MLNYPFDLKVNTYVIFLTVNFVFKNALFSEILRGVVRLGKAKLDGADWLFSWLLFTSFTNWGEL